MKTTLNSGQYLLASLYPCMSFAFFGAILLDISYARALSSHPHISDTTAIYAQAADLLLLLAVFTFLVGLGAVGATGSLPATRNLLIASLFCLAAELLLPALLGPLLTDVQSNSGLVIGPWLRFFGDGMSAGLAFAALYKLHPRKD